MNTLVRIATGLFGLIALATGAAALVKGLDVPSAAAIADNNHRFFAGVWLVSGIGLLHSAVDLAGSKNLFRLLMLAIFVGGVGRAIGMTAYEPETRMIVGTLIETVVPAALVGLHALGLRSDAPSHALA